MKLPFLFATPN